MKASRDETTGMIAVYRNDSMIFTEFIYKLRYLSE